MESSSSASWRIFLLAKTLLFVVLTHYVNNVFRTLHDYLVLFSNHSHQFRWSCCWWHCSGCFGAPFGCLVLFNNFFFLNNNNVQPTFSCMSRDCVDPYMWYIPKYETMDTFPGPRSWIKYGREQLYARVFFRLYGWYFRKNSLPRKRVTSSHSYAKLSQPRQNMAAPIHRDTACKKKKL